MLGWSLKKIVKAVSNPASLVSKQAGKSANIIANPLERWKKMADGKKIRATDYLGDAGKPLDKAFGGNLRNASLFHKIFNQGVETPKMDDSLPGGAPDPNAVTEDVIGDEVNRMKGKRASQLLFGGAMGGTGPLTASSRLFGS